MQRYWSTASAIAVAAQFPNTSTHPLQLGMGLSRRCINCDCVPRDAAGLRDIFPPSVSTAHQGAKADKGAETVILTLHYQTEHTYYVSKDDGAIIALDHAAVDGIIFR